MLAEFFVAIMTSLVSKRMRMARFRVQREWSIREILTKSLKPASPHGTCSPTCSLVRRLPPNVLTRSSSIRSLSIASLSRMSMWNRLQWCMISLSNPYTRLLTFKGWLSPPFKEILTVNGDRLQVVNGKGFPDHGFYEVYDTRNGYYIITKCIQPPDFYNT